MAFTSFQQIYSSVFILCGIFAGSKLVQIHFSVQCLAWRGFSPGTPVFLSPALKTNVSKLQSDQEWQTRNHYVDVLPLNLYLFKYLFILLVAFPREDCRGRGFQCARYVA